MKKEVDIARYNFLRDLQDRNELLFYAFAYEHMEEIIPIIYTPTVGEAVLRYSRDSARFRLTADRTGDVRKAVSKTVTHKGGALFIAALTTAAGFGMLILAPLPPEQQFGIITAMTIIYSYITSIFVLPPVLLNWGEWRKKRKGFIISPMRIKGDS